MKVIDILLLPTSNFFRYCLTGFLYNYSVFFYNIVIPFLADDYGGSSLELAAMISIGTGCVSFFSPFSGKIADKTNPFIIMRLGILAFIIALFFPLFIKNKMWALYVSMIIYGIGGGFFWAVIVGSVGKEAPKGQENRRSAIFSVSWSIGKAFGYLFGGLLKGILGIKSFYIALACLITIEIIYPIRLPKEVRERLKSEKQEKEKKDNQHSTQLNDIHIEMNDSHIIDNSTTGRNENEIINKEELNFKKKDEKVRYKWEGGEYKNKTYIYIGYIFNFAIKGTNWVISSQYIKLVKDFDIKINLFGANPNEMFVGVFFFCLYLAQTTSLVLMALTTQWTYRRSVILLGFIVTVILYLVMALSNCNWLLCILSYIAGLSSGFANQTSVYYSLRASTNNKGLFVGLSEITSGSGMTILPLVAGLLAKAYNDNHVPLYINICVIIMCIIVFDIIYRLMYFINSRRNAKRLSREEQPTPLSTVTQPQKPNNTSDEADDIQIPVEMVPTPLVGEQDTSPSETSRDDNQSLDSQEKE
ncbi:transporter major facilitator family protein, putative [Entamoeba histolytica KU27]|uniref:Transporter major facilitator family protein, putative n=1 Tax=Entamoeba histolytica KU27 TaxID=885311 RepID=M2R6N0_ENTHI|nr:transporter major facilitator family protein, putative [Entamoeba histolytica KU27]